MAVEREVNAAATHVTRKGEQYTRQMLGASGTFVKVRCTPPKVDKPLTPKQRREKKIKSALRDVFRDEGIGQIKQSFEELKKLRSEEEQGLAQLEQAVERLKGITK